MTITLMAQFDDIRPYHDDEVRPTLNRLLSDSCFLNTLAQHNHPILTARWAALMEWLTGILVRNKFRNVNDIRGLQSIIETFLGKVIENTTSQVTFSGLDGLKKGRSYLFISNHRDIVLDPAFLNYGVYRHGLETPRLAIGDNLLTRPFVSDLMRLNKSFIVKRSVSSRRDKLKAYNDLSAYIHHSINTNHSVWIAQSEGRAKDGDDRTDTAMIKMLNISIHGKDISFANGIHSLNIIPVAISYEYDPCDHKKSLELQATASTGQHQKAENEDMLSIATGIKGHKGHVHVAFGSQLEDLYDTAAKVSKEVDKQIHGLYKLHPSNLLAWEHICQNYPEITTPDIQTLFPSENITAKRKEFQQRLCSIPESLHSWIFTMYGNPVFNHYSSTET